MSDETMDTAPLSTWISLILVSAISFWCQAVVTEQRFVPALNLISIKFNIPDDIAGATLMAAGASSPELFSSFVSLFITHSSLGLGTIVGSEIFNQLIICAGSVFAARSGKLELDRIIVAREVFFYALSIFLLYAALQDKRPEPEDPKVDHIFISFFDAVLIFGGYLLYIGVLANMEALTTWFGLTQADGGGLNGRQTDYGSTGSGESSKRSTFDLPDMPFLTQTNIVHEPVGNFSQLAEAVEFSRSFTGQHVLNDGNGNLIESSIRSAFGHFSDHASTRVFRFLMYNEKPSDQHGLHDLEMDAFEDRMSCFLWQKSFFYSKARIATKGWHLRWFAFTSTDIYSVPDRTNFERHRMTYPQFNEIEADDHRLIIKLKDPSPKKRDFYFLAPTTEIFVAVVKKMEGIIHIRANRGQGSGRPSSRPEDDVVSEDTTHHLDLMEFPRGGTNFEVLLFVLLFPFRFLMHFTVPDVQALDAHGIPTATIYKAYLCVFSCLVWLIIGSYAMVTSLEGLAALMNIPDAVVGVTVSAAGTSLPNYVASQAAARNGFGNMAVSNAFGSNTFNIMIGLGLPWVLYIAFTGFTPYHGLQDEGIAESVVILGVVLLVFIVNMVMSGFVMYKWHGILYVVLYLVYLLYVIAGVYLK